MTRESVTAWGLGTIGAAQGAMNYYVWPAITESHIYDYRHNSASLS
jgi:hypothetical protein